MIRGLLPSAHIAVDADAGQPVACLRRQQKVVDAQSLVLLPGTGLVIPESVLAGGVVDGAQRVDQAKPEQRLKTFPGFGAKQGVVAPGGRIMDVASRRNDVEIPG